MAEPMKRKIEIGDNITVTISVKFDGDSEIDNMTIEQLEEYLDELEDQLEDVEEHLYELEDQLEDVEDNESAEVKADYEEWSDKRLELEELIDEVEDRLDALRG